MKNFFVGVPKVIFAILCYLSALLLALLSGYFTVIFYSESQSGWNMYAMGGLAIMLEFIKIMLATAFPFIQYRDINRERKVLFYLKICFLLSVMASMYFFLTGGEILRSPASKISELLYTYVPFLKIIPLQFTQFITTMSLSILIEAFIIFLPILAPILFLDKDYARSQKVNATISWDKIRAIVTIIPERLIDKLYMKVVGVNNILEGKKDDSIKIGTYDESKKQQLHLVENSSNLVKDKLITSSTSSNDDSSNEKSLVFVKDSDSDIKILLDIIYKYKNGNICPSVNKLVQYSDFKKETIIDIKKVLESENILETRGIKTFVLCEYDLALEIINETA